MVLKFITTTELGRLAKWLRILGYDVVYCTTCEKSDLFLKSLREDRIILTRNLKLSKPTSSRILFVKSTAHKQQIRQVVRDLKLKIDSSRMFSRCIVCNELLRKVSKEKIKNKVPPFVFEIHHDFMQCKRCRRVYWAGTHWNNIDKVLDELKIKPATKRWRAGMKN